MKKVELVIVAVGCFLSVCSQAKAVDLNAEMKCFSGLAGTSMHDSMGMDKEERDGIVLRLSYVGAMLESKRGQKNGFYVFSSNDASYYPTPSLAPFKPNQFGAVYSYNFWEFPSGPGIGECRYMTYSMPGGDEAKNDPNPGIAFRCDGPAPNINYVRLQREEAADSDGITAFRADLLKGVRSVTQTYVERDRVLHRMHRVMPGVPLPVEPYKAALVGCNGVNDRAIKKAVDEQKIALQKVALENITRQPIASSGGKSISDLQTAKEKGWQ